jgi:hypothetical protein
VLSRRLFLALLALVYLIAFVSLAVQVQGLIGPEGIAPADAYLLDVRARLGSEGSWRVPTVFWLGASDTALLLGCAAGVALSLVVVTGVAAGPALALLWGLYLSYTSIGNVFLRYQWDALLIETGFLALFLAPWSIRRHAPYRTTVPRVPLWLLRWLLFRLMFMSGAMKLLSGDDAWRDFSALSYHYFTQPLPGFTSWFAHHLPAFVHAASVLATFAVEIGASVLLWFGRTGRLAACGAFVALQLAIAATGNYGFFNLLALVLCVPLLDDAALRALTPGRWRPRLPRFDALSARSRPPAGHALLVLLFVAVATLSGLRMLDRLGAPLDVPVAVENFARRTAAFRSVNAYGLFAVMTTRRPEILIEGSHDGERWLAYELPWKPGRLDRAPGFSQPHMPRLDWQLWFAALGRCERNRWFVQFLGRLLQGAPEVHALLDDNPFPDTPPRYVRSTTYHYTFSDPAELWNEGHWWRRERIGPYCPDLTLDGGVVLRRKARGDTPR